MNKLPSGWTLAQIGKLSTLNNGRAFKPTEWAHDGFPIVRIQNLNNPSARFNYFNGVCDPKYHLSGGDLLFAWSGTPGTSFGAHIWRGGEAVLNQHIFRVDFDESIIDKRFFRYAINQTLAELINIAHGGVGLRHVTKGKFENTKVVLPPIAEQKHIADKLDSLLPRVDACRERLDRVPLILKRFRQSVLAAATSGALTENWRRKQGGLPQTNDFKPAASPDRIFRIPKEWAWVAVGELAEKVTDGVHKKPTYVKTGIPFLTVKNLTRGRGIDFSDTKFISPDDHQEFCKRTKPEKGDILITKDGTLGVVRLIETTSDFSIFVSLALIKPKDKSMSKYLTYALQSPVAQAQMIGVGTGLQHIHLKDLKQDVLPIPPHAEQLEIVRRIEKLFAVADQLEIRLDEAVDTIDRLSPSVLAKAFRGELVPQDPNDEPAIELLKRLASNQTAQPERARGRRAAKARAA